MTRPWRGHSRLPVVDALAGGAGEQTIVLCQEAEALPVGCQGRAAASARPCRWRAKGLLCLPTVDAGPKILRMKRRRVQRGALEGRLSVPADFEEPDQERMSLMLADAIEGLEDLAAGRVLDDAEVYRMLSVARTRL